MDNGASCSVAIGSDGFEASEGILFYPENQVVIMSHNIGCAGILLSVNIPNVFSSGSLLFSTENSKARRALNPPPEHPPPRNSS
jgi:hypothetical protein